MGSTKIKLMKYFCQLIIEYLSTKFFLYNSKHIVQLLLNMAMSRYFKPKDSLPDPRGPLSHSLPSRAMIAMVNREVEKTREKANKKRGCQHVYRRADCYFPCVYKQGSLIQQSFSVSSIGCFQLWPAKTSLHVFVELNLFM